LESALIVSQSEKATAFFTDILLQDRCSEICTQPSADAARRQMARRDFDLCVINAPLSDEFGDLLAQTVAENGVSQVILVVRAEVLDEVTHKLEEFGVMALPRPLTRAFFWNALKLAGAASARLRTLQSENARLSQRIEDIRLADRAKCALMEYLKMSEADAHRYIEKQAMDLRRTKRQVAESILKTYDL